MDRASGRPPHTGAIVLGVLLAINPPIVFLLSRSLILTIAGPCIALVVVLLAYRRFGLGRPTLYVINICSLVGVFLYGEVVFSVAFPDYVIEDLYQLRDGYYFNKPDLTSKLDGKEFNVDYLTNKDGFRIGYSQYTDVTFDFADWLFIGDSFTQAAQVSFEDMFTTILYRMYPSEVVVNAGVSGFGIPQELALYKDLGRRLKPRRVFLQLSPFNDFMNVRESKRGLSDVLVNKSNFIRFLLQDFKYKNPATLPLGRWTEPFYPTEEENRDYNIFYKESSDQKRADIRAFRRYMAEFAAAVRDDGAQLTVLLLPTKEQTNAAYLQEVVDAFHLDLRELDLKRPQRMMRALADSLGFQLIDLWEPFATAEVHPFLDYDEHLSPAGHRLVAAAIAKAIGASEATPRILSSEYAGDRYPAPDGRGHVYYQSTRGGSMELFVGDSLLQGSTQLTYNDVDESHPTVSYDATMLAFTEGDAGEGRTRVAIADMRGQRRHYVDAGSSDFGAIPFFSPVSPEVAYADWHARPDGHLTPPRIAVRDLRSDSTRFVTPEDAETWRPVFSPDGRYLAYIMKEAGQFDLYEADLTDGTTHRLTDTPYDEWDPRFSPDGSRLVYSAREDGNWDLFMMKLSTLAVERLTKTRGDEWDPAFSDDGRSVLYGGQYGIFRGIYILPVN